MKKQVDKYLFDILSSIESIENYLGEKRNYFDYHKNQMLKDAIERRLEIIGEATSCILKIDKNIAITHARRIVNLRNKVIHAYDAIDDANIWAIIVNSIPKLKKEVEELLRQE